MGSDLRFSQLESHSDLRPGESNPSVGKDTRLGQCRMVKDSSDRLLLLWRPSIKFEKDSKLGQSRIVRNLSFGKRFKVKDFRESQLLPRNRYSKFGIFLTVRRNSNFPQLSTERDVKELGYHP